MAGRHTSGVVEYSDDEQFLTTLNESLLLHRFTPDDLVGYAVQHPPLFAPGARWSYSSANYVIAGMILERVTGRSGATEVMNRVVRPLGLRDTSVPVGPDLPRPHATGYFWDSDTSQYLDVTRMDPSWAGAAGAMVSTVRDLGAFWRAIGQGRLLPPAQVTQLRTTVPMNDPENPGAAMGLGIASAPLSCGGVYWAHNGELPGYMTVNGVRADGRGGVVISVSGHGRADRTRALARQIVDRALCAGR